MLGWKVVIDGSLSAPLQFHTFFSSFFFNYFPFFLQEIKDEQQSTQTSSKVKKKERIKPDSSIQNDQTAMLDTWVHQLKDQIIRAKVYLYFPAARNNPHFTRELQGRMKEVQ